MTFAPKLINIWSLVHHNAGLLNKMLSAKPTTNIVTSYKPMLGASMYPVNTYPVEKCKHMARRMLA